MAQTSSKAHMQSDRENETRRDFLYVVTAAAAAVGTGIALWPLINSMNPSAEVLALATVEVDLGPVQVGQRITVVWRGKPVFIDHRTREQITRARTDDDADLKDPQEAPAFNDWNGSLSSVSARTWAASQRGRDLEILWVNLAAGSVLATDPNTTPPDASGRVRPLKTSQFHLMHSWTTCTFE